MQQEMSILQSKLLVPKTAHAIPRTFLEKMRDDILRKKAVVVCAGPGFGKTTCIAQAVEELDTAWIRIDSTDTDLNVFLTYLISGIRKHYSSFGDAIFRLLAEAGATGVAPDELIRMLLSDLESQIHQPFVIVLDDYHQVHATSVIRQSMQFFIENQPGHIHVIFISRVPVELSLSKLRASLDILDIGTRDLTFSKEETDRLFQETLSTPLSNEQLDLLQERSGGWISGLILFYHSLSGKACDVSRQLGKLQGTRGFIFDYMDENIFSAIDETLKAFLMKTSVLSHMNAGYCNKLPGINNAEDTLEHLASINMFTFCLDEDKQEYCYHHLFQDFLRKKLEKSMDPAELQHLHSQTASVLEASGENEEAVRHYLYAESYQDACRVISGIVKALIRQVRLSLINEYLTALPDTVIENEPWILYLRGIKYTFVGRFRESLTDLSTAYDVFIARGDDEGANRCLADMGTRYYLAGDFYKAEETFKKLAAGRSVELPTRLEVLGHLIFVSSYLYKFDEADRYIEETESYLGTPAGYISEEVPRAWFKINISLRYWASGDFDRAIEEAGEVDVFYLEQRNHFRLLPLYYQIMALYYHHQARFQEGLDMALAGLELTERMGYRETAMGWILCYAGANSYALGNIDQAIAYGEECVRLFQALESPWGVGTGYMVIQIAQLVAGDYEISIETGNKILIAAGKVSYPLMHGSVKAYITEAMIHLNRIDEAEKLLQEAEEDLRHTKIQDCHLSLLHAFIAEQKGDRNGAMDRARQSLAYVRNEGLGNHFISDRTWLVPCLVALYAGKEYRPEIESILEAMGGKALDALSGLEHHGDDSRSVQTIRELIGCVPSRKAPGLNVCCLGRFRLFLGEKEISADHWKSKKARTLLKLLIHYSPRGYTSKEVFMEHLWPGQDPDKTAKRFHVALAAIRKTLEPDIFRGVPSSYIKSDLDTYQLSVGENGTIDSLMFEHLCRKSNTESDTAGRISVLLQATNLYQGAYFGEDLYEDWCVEVREHLKTLYLNSLADLIAYYEEAKDYSNAIEFCQRYLKEDCYAERIYQKLMRFHALTSSPDQVRQTYFRCRDAIVSDLGCPLSRETDLLLQELTPDASL